jgi:hypothetical protein
MMDDTLALEEDEEIEEEADAEVDKVLFDLTNGKLGQAGTIQNTTPVSDNHNHTLLVLSIHFLTVNGGPAGRRRDRKSHGAVQATTKRSAQLIELLSFFVYRPVICLEPLLYSTVWLYPTHDSQLTTYVVLAYQCQRLI